MRAKSSADLRRFAAAGAAIMLAAQTFIALTGPLVSSVEQRGDTIVLEPTWRAWIAPPWMSTRAWDEAQKLAPEGILASPKMRDQYLCHWIFARPVWPLQRTWGLDGDRPDVGLVGVVAAACNPS